MGKKVYLSVLEAANEVLEPHGYKCSIVGGKTHAHILCEHPNRPSRKIFIAGTPRTGDNQKAWVKQDARKLLKEVK